jgi:hypothetical protein
MAIRVVLPDPLPKSVWKKIMALAANEESSLARGDFVVAMYLRNLLLDCLAGRDPGPKYLPDYLPMWLEAVGTSLNSRNNADAALRAGELVVGGLRRPEHHQSSSMSSPPISVSEQPRSEEPSSLGWDDERPPDYSRHATPNVPPPSYYSIFQRQTPRHGLPRE